MEELLLLGGDSQDVDYMNNRLLFMFGVILSLIGIGFFGRENMYVGNLIFIVGLAISITYGKKLR